jgi:hypothetical protein
MKVPRSTTIAETAALTPEQKAFRERAKGGVLAFALPLDQWVQQHFAVRRGQKMMPVARRGEERWYDASQVEPGGLSLAAPRRRIVIVQGGSMSGLKNRRK